MTILPTNDFDRYAVKFLRRNGLSAREAEIGFLAIRGYSNDEMAPAMGVKEKTIRFHLTSIYKKVGVKNRLHFMVWYMDNYLKQPWKLQDLMRGFSV